MRRNWDTVENTCIVVSSRERLTDQTRGRPISQPGQHRFTERLLSYWFYGAPCWTRTSDPQLRSMPTGHHLSPTTYLQT